MFLVYVFLSIIIEFFFSWSICERVSNSQPQTKCQVAYQSLWKSAECIQEYITHFIEDTLLWIQVVRHLHYECCWNVAFSGFTVFSSFLFNFFPKCISFTLIKLIYFIISLFIFLSCSYPLQQLHVCIQPRKCKLIIY